MTIEDIIEVDLYIKATKATIKDLRKRVEALEQRLNKEETQ